MSTYVLGVDVGTTYSACAIVRDGHIEAVPISTNLVSVPSAIWVSSEETLYSTAALRRGTTTPQGLAREYKRRIGDPVPLVLSGEPHSADQLQARFTRWMVDQTAEQLGSTAERVVVTHPANWTSFQTDLLERALAQVGLEDAKLLSEPEAAATDYAAAAGLNAGEIVLVYDLGGGTFDLVLLRYEGVGFAELVDPRGVDRLGGIDFDEAIYQHVLGRLPTRIDATALSTTERSMLNALRRSCTDAKEALSSDHSVDIPVLLPEVTTEVTVTRAEFENMIRPSINQTIELVQRSLDDAGLSPDELSAVLLVGGSSRIPLIADMVQERLQIPVRVDAHPKLVVSKGAARAAAFADEPAAAKPPRRRRRTPNLRILGAVAAGIAAIVVIGVVLANVFSSSEELSIVGPPEIEAGVEAVYFVEGENPPVVDWTVGDDEFTDDVAEITVDEAGSVEVVARSDDADGTQVVVVRAAQEFVIDGPSSLRVGDSGRYEVAGTDSTDIVWTVGDSTQTVSGEILTLRPTSSGVVDLVARIDGGSAVSRTITVVP